MSQQTADDAFHEIQFSGKQLFFLFMAASVVSVVIFLCGVLVGRGVQAERRLAADAEALNAPSADAQPQPALPTATASAVPDPGVVPPSSIADDLAIVKGDAPGVTAKSDRRTGSAVDEKPPAPDPVGSRAASVAAVNAPAPKTIKATAGKESPAPKASGGTGNWVVQVAALNVRSEADAFAKDLSSRGYGAYVMVPPRGVSVYRVRVGGFKTRREADGVADKLRKEGHKPWVTTR